MSENLIKDTKFSIERIKRKDSKDIILDNLGERYEFIQSMYNNEILVFKNLNNGKTFHFNNKGKLINAENVCLHIEYNDDFGRYPCLLCNYFIVYFKITDYCYFTFSLSKEKTNYEYVEVRDANEFFGKYTSCHYPMNDLDKRKEIIDKLYDFGFGCSISRHEIFPLAKNIEKGKYYINEDSIFKASEDIKEFDSRTVSYIPYEFYILRFDVALEKPVIEIHENSQLGIGYYSCFGLRECTEKEKNLADEIYNLYKTDFNNVEYRIRLAQRSLEDAMKMLKELKCQKSDEK